jgi:hypothetical protein
MNCPKCDFEQPEGNTECPKCGIIFEKYLARREKTEAEPAGMETASVVAPAREDETPGWVRELFFHVEDDINPLYLGGRVIFYLVLVVWGIKFILAPMDGDYINASFLHLINHPFHEAGHVIFRPFGKFITMLGGSLAQLIVPLVCLGTFLLQTRDTFASSVALWWFSQSLMDIAPYIGDARKLTMILIGGVTGRDVDDFHDWEFILRKVGLLEYDRIIARTADLTGIVLMSGAFTWGGYLLYRQFRNVSRA